MQKKRIKKQKQIDIDIDIDDQENVVSKTAVKKALQDILLLGESLLELNAKKLEQLPLSELLLTEIALAKKLKVDNSRRRQMQRIAKIIRSENAEEIQMTYTELQKQNRQHQQSIHPAEKWCARLIEDADSLVEFIDRFPKINRQQLSQTIRNAKKEKITEGSSNKNQQRLYKIVQETLRNNIG